MIADDLKEILRQNSRVDNRLYLLNLVKEEIQSYLLYFVYTHKLFRKLIFTGGTCLRRIYGLNRLSVDLDFDYETETGPQAEFAEQVSDWLRKEHQLKDATAVVRKESVKVKFGGLFEETGKEVIFVSVDFSRVSSTGFKTEQNLVSTPRFSFLVKNFDLPTLFANKICAFLYRRFTSGSDRTVPFKGRDLYDLFWLCQRSRQEGYRLKPNFDVLSEVSGISDNRALLRQIGEKIEAVRKGALLTQLLPFFPERDFVESVVSTCQETLPRDLKIILE